MEDAALLVVLGATATGKSALALRLAESLAGEIVNLDALQVYRGLDVGTAKAADQLARALGELTMLLVVDNVEHLLDAGPVLAALARKVSSFQSPVSSSLNTGNW